MSEESTLSAYYSTHDEIDITDDDSDYSKIELIATGTLSSDADEVPGIQQRIYNAWRNSWNAKEFAKYPVDLCLRISHIFDECCARVLNGENRKNAVTNVSGLSRLVEKLDQTTSKEFKIFAGFDGRRWDFRANMDAKKAVLYIKNSAQLEIIMNYLVPFVPVDMARYLIAEEIEKKHKSRVC